MRALDERVARAIAVMKRQRERPVSINQLARAVNLSPSYLTRLFRQHVGCPPAHYDRGQRLDHAYELVTSSRLSIKEIMAAVGWSDPSHFSRDFRSRFGLSPRALRSKHLAESSKADQDADRPTETPIRQQYTVADRDHRNKT
jgi:transcriptional regulator GlxA family with amidase domain